MGLENNTLRVLKTQGETLERVIDVLERLPEDHRAYDSRGNQIVHPIYAQNGTLTADGIIPTSRGRTVGPTPFNHLGDQLISVIRAADPGQAADVKLFEIAEARATGMSEGVGSEGGFMLQDNFSNELLGSVFADPDILSKINMTPISKGNNLKVPAVNETSRADGSRQGGVQMYWLAEGGTKTKSKPDLRLIDLELKKLIGLVYLTDELLDDTTALESYVRRAFQREMKFKMIDALINGSGAGQPLGILASPCLVTQAIETGQATATVVYENMIKMFSRFIGNYATASWHCNQDVFPELLNMGLSIGFGGSPVLMPPSGNSPYNRFLGIPIIPLEQCKTLGTKGDLFLVDWTKYIGIDKGAMQVASSIHVQFVTDESVLRFVYRVDMEPELASAITPYSGSTNTLSPFVCLAARP